MAPKLQNTPLFSQKTTMHAKANYIENELNSALARCKQNI